MHEILAETRYALRQLRHHPTSLLMAVVSIAIGIGANTAVFSLVDALLLRDLAGTQPERLVRLHSVWKDGSSHHSFSHPTYLSYRQESADVLDGLAAEYSTGAALGAGLDGRTIVLNVVTADYFKVLGLEPHLGRFFLEEENHTRGATAVAVLDHRSWTRDYGADTGVLGRTLLINGAEYTVVGVAPPDFYGTTVGLRATAYVPMMMMEQANPGSTVLRSRGSLGLELIGRLAPGIGIETARARLRGVTANLAAAYPEVNEGQDLEVVRATSLGGELRGPVRAFLIILAGVVGMVLLIACLNVANVLVARSVGRQREVAIRRALGASSGRLLRLFLTETLLLFVVGATLGVGLAHLATRALLSIRLPLPFPIHFDLGLNATVLAFTLLTTLLAALVAGLAPALRSAAVTPSSLLQATDLRSGGSQSRLRGALVVAQISLSIVLVVVAGLFVRALNRAGALDPGFDPRGVHVASLDLSTQGYGIDEARAFYSTLLDHLGVLRGIESAALADMVPLSLSNQEDRFAVDGFEPPGDFDGFVADTMMVSAGYFDTLRIPLETGRDFSSFDRAGSQEVAIVNRTMADRFWPSGAVGRAFHLERGADDLDVTVVGVVSDSKYRSLAESPRLYFYRPLQQAYSNDAIAIHVRSQERAEVLLPALRDTLRDLDPSLPLVGAAPMKTVTGISLLPQRLASYLSGGLGVVGLWLASVGLYGLTAFTVNSRRREIGIRMVLGASSSGVVRRFVLRSGGLALLGIGIGLIAAASLGSLLAGFLYGLSPTDPGTFAAVAAIFLAVASAASFFPARRAARIHPAEALRYE